MKSGIYALASLDGSPLTPEDIELLGLATSAEKAIGSRGFCGRAVDELPSGGAVDAREERGEISLFLGYLHELEEAAAHLGLQAVAGAARLTNAALERWGAEAAWRLIGDYSHLKWNTQTRELTLFTSQRIRDQLYWATNGKHIAVSSDLLLLTRLPWVGRTIDTIGFALTMSDYRLRRYRTTETMWTGISRLPAGWSARIDSSGVKLVPLGAHTPVADWNGSFDEAVEEITRIGRRIVGQQMARYGRTAFLLSGGLDSSLTTLLGSMERQSAEAMFCLTSVAPEGSDLADEWGHSKSVADALNLPMYPVRAAGEKVLRLPDGYAEHFGTPTLGFRQHLYQEFVQSARENGSTLIIDGVGGEYTVSMPDSLARPGVFRRLVRATRSSLRGGTQDPNLQATILVRLQSDVLASLPESWNAEVSKPVGEELRGKRRGVSFGVRRNAEAETSWIGGGRFFFPYLDARLLRFAAGLPRDFFLTAHVDRKLARAVLRGRVPDTITDRTTKLPISPTYLKDVQVQADAEKSRLRDFRNAGLDRILDLDWLEKGLAKLAAGDNPYSEELTAAQITLSACQFLAAVRTL